MLTELRPKKELLDPNFGGYKLSLDSIPVYRQSINEGADHVCQSEDQYSFIHTKVFSLHNHLFCDPWHNNTVFLVDKGWNVLKATINSETGRLEALQTVWKIPGQTHRKSGHYNVSILLPSSQVVVVTDGCGWLHTLSRADDSQWQVELSSEVVAGVLLSARTVADTLHCVLMTLETQTAEEVISAGPRRSDKPKPAVVNTILHWVVFTKDSEGVWSESCKRQLEGAGSVDYVALEVSGSALYIDSNANFKFTSDSANPLPPPEEKMEIEEQNLYVWEQTKDDVKVTVEVGPKVTRDDVEVSVTEGQLTIRCGQQLIVSGALSRAVDQSLTTWTLQPNRLEVILVKQDSGMMWPELVKGDTRGQQILDPDVVEDVHNRLSHLCSDTEVQEAGEGFAPTFNLDQLEDCDTAPEDSWSLLRLEAESHSITHQISLAGHQWLMAVSEGPDRVPSMCVRHDVDGCVWRLEPPTTEDWPCHHVGTFYALGYVAASKQQKKFMLAAPDLSYTVICEATSHVFVYRKSSTVEGELRNRKTSTKIPTVAKQQLINLESSSSILGACATNSHLFILTTETLYCFHIQ
ncbi:nudC domain-containing protein 1 [Homalodisca vitripennis]|nr:nudC domain-containing protein 1 [Homalodisca vitripennis]XP_046673858.1 nudC domain-containing protein 1 [Homalodisca vitripennis]